MTNRISVYHINPNKLIAFLNGIGKNESIVVGRIPVKGDFISISGKSHKVIEVILKSDASYSALENLNNDADVYVTQGVAPHF